MGPCYQTSSRSWAQDVQRYISHLYWSTHLSKSWMVDSVFIFSFSWILFSVFFSFIFLFLEQLGLGLISYAVTSVTNWWHSHKTDHGTQENEVEGTRIKWRHTTWTIHVGLMLYSWPFRARYTVVSMDHEY